MKTVVNLKHQDIRDLKHMLNGKDRAWCSLGIQLLPEVPKIEIQFFEHGYAKKYSFSRRFTESLTASEKNIKMTLSLHRETSRLCASVIQCPLVEKLTVLPL